MARQQERREATISAIKTAARRLFTARGFDATTIDDIAERAGVAKGAVYHHFPSKEELFVAVLDGVQEEIAALPVPAASRRIHDPIAVIADGVLRYLLAASEPERRRILLIDGPAVCGWRRWREIDSKYFGAGTRVVVRAALGPRATARDVDAVSHLLLGAVMEAALLCAVADDPRAEARTVVAALRRLLEGLRRDVADPTQGSG